MLETTINGRWSILLPSHRHDRAEWTSDAGWERERLDSMFANLGPGDVVYDIGAEEGDFAGLFATWVAGANADWSSHFGDTTPGGVVLLEPNPRVWPNIKAIWDANHLDPPIAWWVGLASDQTSVDHPSWDVYRDSSPPVWPSCANGAVIGDHGFKSLVESEQSIPNVRLDDLAVWCGRPPSAMTIDVEGAELRVLYGAAEVLDTARPLVWVSVHPAMMDYDYHCTPEDLHAYMGRHGYVLKHLARDHENHVFYVPEERAGAVTW